MFHVPVLIAHTLSIVETSRIGGRRRMTVEQLSMGLDLDRTDDP